jgi:hypothetical protein
MGKAIGILLFVVAIWLGLQYYTAEAPRPDPEQKSISRAQAVGERVQDALASGVEREQKVIPE